MSAESAGERAPDPTEPRRRDDAGDASPPPTSDGDVLEAAHEARLLQAGRMLAGIVHEIRNPLAVIQGYAQLLQEKAPDPEDAEDLRRILAETRRLGSLVDDMLSFVRRDGARQQASVDLARVVQAALNLTTHAMRQSGVTVVASAPASGCHVVGQSGAYIQVLLNLLDNARESLEEGRAGDRGIAVKLDERDAHWRVDVTNNGPPVPPDVAGSIFDSFFTTKQERSGTGLGLALCREILERFGGSIRLLGAEETDAAVAFRLEFPKA